MPLDKIKLLTSVVVLCAILVHIQRRRGPEKRVHLGDVQPLLCHSCPNQRKCFLSSVLATGKHRFIYPGLRLHPPVQLFGYCQASPTRAFDV